MGFDWRRLERGERRRHERVAVVMGAAFAVLGAVGIVVSLVLGRFAATTGNVVWLLLGAGMLVVGLRARRRGASEEQAGRGGGDRADEVQPPPP